MRTRLVQVFCVGIIFTSGLLGQNFGEITGTVTDQSARRDGRFDNHNHQRCNKSGTSRRNE